MTYSIVARDPETGELGVAVQSHHPGVGPIVPWLHAGVGAVATQAFALVDHGPRTLAGMAAGQSAGDALGASLAVDEQREVRQVGAVDATGRASSHTGTDCITHAEHVTGAGFAAQANIMEHPGIPAAMGEAFEATDGPLEDRLLAALLAAEERGGDLRGRQSAALVTVGGERTELAWQGRLTDVRVDEHGDPLGELQRLLHLQQAHGEASSAEELLEAGRADEAIAAFHRAFARSSDDVELRFWAAVSAFDAGQRDWAREVLAAVVDAEPQWEELLRRLAGAGRFAGDVDDALRGV